MSGQAALSGLSSTSSGRAGRLPAWLDHSGRIAALSCVTLLAIFAVLYHADPALYLRTLRYWVPEALPYPFIDTAYVQQQLECWRAGVNVYVANPCEITGRGNAYPPLWLRLWFLPVSPAATVPLALIMAAGFFVSLLVLPLVRRRVDLCLFLAAVASPVTAYAVERGNADLLMFSLAALAVAVTDRSLPIRVIGHAGVLTAALLKLYPAVLLILVARERPRFAAAIGLASIAILLLLGWLWHDQWALMMPNIPLPMYAADGPGARKLPEGLFVLLNSFAKAIWLPESARLDDLIPRRAATVLFSAVFVVCAILKAMRLSRDAAFVDALRRLSSRERLCLAVGGLLFCGCFATGTSISYREIMLLFALPALLRLGHDQGLTTASRAVGCIVVALMWVAYPGLLLDIHFGPLGAQGGPVPTFAFWLVREVLWWWLFIFLTAAVLCLPGIAARPDIGEDADTSAS